MATAETRQEQRERGERSFTLLLRTELAARRRKNPRYSLRAFARALQVDHATLSQVLRGARPLTAASVAAMGKRLNLEVGRLSALVAAEKTGESRIVTPEILKCAEGVLDLTGGARFRPDSRWIAAALRVPPDDINRALSWLIHVGALEMEADGRWIDRRRGAR